MKRRGATAAAIFVALCTTLCREPLAIVRDGKPLGVIVAPLAETGAVGVRDDVQAGRELSLYLQKMTGAAVPVVGTAHTSKPCIRVGVFGQDPVAEWKGTAPPRDGFVIERRGATLFIVGGDARGALYGAYDFLERDLGVRWFMPGELGEDVPSRKTVLLPEGSRRGQPAFEAVAGFEWAGSPAARAWEKHVRALVGPPSSFFGHNWSRIIPPTAETFTAHPDWFALHDGRRTTEQLCSSHPDVVRTTAARAREFFDAHPEAAVFSISPNDGDGFCECPRCRAIDELYGVTDGSLSDRLAYFANEVMADLERTHPSRQVGMLAYLRYTKPPRRVQPHPHVATLVTRMPWEFCHVHSLDDPHCEINARFVEYVRGWKALGSNVGVYDYYGHFDAFTPWPLVHTIRRDLPFLRRLGVTRFMSETQQHWANQGLNFYLGARLAWDPEQDVDALLDDFFTRFYGEAAEPMRRYWMRWEEAMTSAAHGGNEWQRMFTPSLVAECEGILKEAEARAAHDRDKVKGRVALARSGLRFTSAWTEMRDHAGRAEWAAAIAAGEEAVRRLRETDNGSDPWAFSVPLAVSQTEAALRPYREALTAHRAR